MQGEALFNFVPDKPARVARAPKKKPPAFKSEPGGPCLAA